MSGPGAPGGAGSLEALFASLRTQASSTNDGDGARGNQQQPQGAMPPFARYPSGSASHSRPGSAFDVPHTNGTHQPTVSSPLPDPDPRGPQPHHRSAVMSPNVPTPNATASPAPAGAQSNPDRTANLLNLLKFNQSNATAPSPTSRQFPQEVDSQDTPGQDNKSGGISASDLVASFMGKPAPPSINRTPSTTSVAPSKPEVSRDFAESTPSPSAHTQDFLLKLLNRPKGSPTEPPSSFQPDKLLAAEKDVGDSSKETRVRDHGHRTQEEAAPPRKFEAESRLTEPSSAEKAGQSIFTYVNPFEQLAASSPRHRTPKAATPRSRQATPDVDTLRSSKVPQAFPGVSEMATHPHPHQGYSAHRRVSPREDTRTREIDALPATSSPAPAPLPDGRSQMEALLGIGAESRGSETVAEALTGIGESVNQEVEKALAEAHIPATDDKKSNGFNDLHEEVKDLAADMKAELDRSENEGALEEALPEPIAEAVKDLIDGAAEAHEDDSWESAEDGEPSTKSTAGHVVRVYNFPMKPFSTLSIQKIKWPNPVFRQETVMDIARLKKEFDQVDRTLTTATKDFIVYAMAKNGGLRVIAQDDGRDMQVFGNTKDRIFAIAAATAPSSSATGIDQAVLATGVSGTVYWMPLLKDGENVFDNEDIESHKLVFPPTASQEESSSGGQLKTRARKSSRHPEFFAVGRGKAIHIVWPTIAGSREYLAKDRTVDTQKYLYERCLKIATGKAGKDFTFSEDDSIIASLDKLGRLRFWDIRELTDEIHAPINGKAPPANPPLEIKTPLVTLMTTAPSEKAWPSSVMFVDKPRSYLRGIALRYMLLGMKQNHTLQLWDLALGRAIQELNLPHTGESDAICSVAYHHPSSIIVVGHPTRNSIYFIHLSAPRYSIPNMSQARYMERIAQRDPTLPKPDVTAIMSGFREFSLASKGQLRSVDILSQPSATTDDPDNPLLFELYVMHSKGVSCMSINREDLGWSKENKVLHPVDAEERGVITVEPLRELPENPMSSGFTVEQPSTASASTVSLPQTVSKISKPVAPAADEALAQAPKKEDKKANAAPPATLNGSAAQPSPAPEKQEKKKKKRAAAAETSARATDEVTAVKEPPAPPDAQPPQQNEATAHEAPAKATGSAKSQKPLSAQNGEITGKPAKQESHPAPVQTPQTNLDFPSELLDQEMKKVEKSISAEFTRVISHELGGLYRRFDEDKRIQQASGDAKQDAVLRLVSSTLSENVEKSLARMIGQNIQQSVVPAIVDVTASSLERNVSQTVREHFHVSLSKELRSALPETIGRAFQSPDVLRTISDLVADKVAVHVESEFSSILHGTISPAFKQLSLDAAQRIAGDVERRTAEKINIAEVQRQNDSQKIDELHDLVRGLTQMVSKMADAQSDFQTEILKLQRQLQQAESRQSVSSGTPAQERSVTSRQTQRESPHKSPEQEEHDTILGMMRQNRYEEATISWLQSKQQEELFENIFVHCDPVLVQALPPLVVLSVAASITSTLESRLRERLEWVDSCFASINPADSDVLEVLSKIIDVLVQRLEALYMRIAETNYQDPLLRKIPTLTRTAKQLKLAGSGFNSPESVRR